MVSCLARTPVNMQGTAISPDRIFLAKHLGGGKQGRRASKKRKRKEKRVRRTEKVVLIAGNAPVPFLQA